MNANKRFTSIISIAFAVSLLLFTPGESFCEGYAGYAGAFLRMGGGSISMGGGDAAVARAIGVEQAHYNPAGLPYAHSNEASLTYNKLSMDRRLLHAGFLYQVPQIAFWAPPMQRLEALRARDNTPAMLVKPGSEPGRRGRNTKVDSYIKPLAKLILEASDIPGLADEPPMIEIDGIEYQALVLQEVVQKTSEYVRQNNISTVDEIIEILRKHYRTTRSKPAAIALTWTHAGTDNIEGRNLNGEYYGDLGFFENRFALSFGLKLHEKVSLGVTAGVLYALIPDMIENDSKALTSTTFGADVGLQLRPFLGTKSVPLFLESLTLGAARYDIAAKNTWNTTGYWSQGTTKTDKFPDRYRFGASIRPVKKVDAFF